MGRKFGDSFANSIGLSVNKNVGALNTLAERVKLFTDPQQAMSSVKEAIRTTNAPNTAELMKMPQEREAMIRVLENMRPEVFTSKAEYDNSRKDIAALRKATDDGEFAKQLGSFYGKIKGADATKLNDVPEINEILAANAPQDRTSANAS